MYLSTGLSGLAYVGKNQKEYYNKKPILPSEEELEYNSRSKSAKLRIFEHC